MPRNPSFTINELTDKALQHFWMHGYHATSMDDLVKVTSISRHGIYSTFGGKKKLFVACFDRYQDIVVSPAFSSVEDPNADFSNIEAYFEFQISAAEGHGLPGLGCFVVNSTTENAPHDTDVMLEVAKHNTRLREGFQNALRNECINSKKSPDSFDVEALSNVLVIFANGLWSMSRTVSHASELRFSAKTFLATIKGGLK